ncbi:MAG TPA: hypothetical protein DCS07_01450 [Bdellovibrionales bacterium]|nr:MAG: hypothetical protein A2Z97_00320 [Bdellovibrionales bacterium GWB1_52_6]OFZ05868.1 MAG: hypothetical protein A2X97_12525 [Bdellovibrionales bacterium GWA1_52_35]OFZ33325.1 MAG: hypothetical protein A2070_06625 [Bdellovibrionales bacterium GWC1_52_8]HAR41290.1 hypothetical protein [Bdellovibrionales bacterium]HCM39758.1 hypothetical protein [Bdellovibrionales bacterium]
MINDTVNRVEVEGSLDEVIDRITEALNREGFGILTRIDLHSKFREKLGKEISPAVILGACNPQLAYEAYQCNSDVASLLPCNVVVREVSAGRCSVELARPSVMMEMLGDEKLVALSRDADQRLERCLSHLETKRAA